jgi:hypothetical protein
MPAARAPAELPSCATTSLPIKPVASFVQSAPLPVLCHARSIEYNVSYVYHALWAFFDRDNVALPGRCQAVLAMSIRPTRLLGRCSLMKSQDALGAQRSLPLSDRVLCGVALQAWPSTSSARAWRSAPTPS